MLKMIRWKGLLGFVSVIGLLVAFWLFYASTLIKDSIESYGSEIVGAKVDVASVNLSFEPLGITISKLEVTDADQPMQNLVQLEKINAQLALTPLFLGKVVIEDVSIEGVAFQTARATSGALPKTAQPAAESTAKSGAAKDEKAGAGAATADQVAAEEPDSSISDELPSVSEILAKESLQTEELGKIFKETLDKRKVEVDAAVKALPSKQELERYGSELKEITRGKVTSLPDFQARAKKLSEVKARMNEDKAAIAHAKQVINTAKSELQGQLQELKAAPGKDLDYLKGKYQLNMTGAANISQLLFGDQFKKWQPLIAEYYEKAKPMIAKLQEKKEEEKARERLTGRYVTFAEKDPLPSFLIRRMAFSVSLTNGDLATTWTDITHQHAVIQRPTRLKINGVGFADKARLVIDGTFDSRGEQMFNQLTLDMSGFDVHNLPLAGKTLVLNQATTAVQGQATFNMSELDLSARANFEQAQFRQSGGSGFEKEVGIILASIDNFDVNGEIKGRFSDPDISLSSNLDKRYDEKMNARFEEKKKAFEQEMKEQLNDKLLSYTGKYQQQLKELDLANGSMDENRKKLEGLLKAELAKFDNGEKEKAKQKLEAEASRAKEKLKNALKNFKF